MAIETDHCKRCGIPIDDDEYYCRACILEFELAETEFSKWLEENESGGKAK